LKSGVPDLLYRLGRRRCPQESSVYEKRISKALFRFFANQLEIGD
jgi:hypothetical protein